MRERRGGGPRERVRQVHQARWATGSQTPVTPHTHKSNAPYSHTHKSHARFQVKRLAPLLCTYTHDKRLRLHGVALVTRVTTEADASSLVPPSQTRKPCRASSKKARLLPPIRKRAVFIPLPPFPCSCTCTHDLMLAERESASNVTAVVSRVTF